MPNYPLQEISLSEANPQPFLGPLTLANPTGFPSAAAFPPLLQLLIWLVKKNSFCVLELQLDHMP